MHAAQKKGAGLYEVLSAYLRVSKPAKSETYFKTSESSNALKGLGLAVSASSVLNCSKWTKHS